MKKVKLFSEEWKLEMLEAEMELKHNGNFGVGIPFPPEVIIPNPYEGFTEEELQQEEARLRAKLKSIVAQEKERNAQRVEYLRKHGIIVSSPDVSDSPGVCAK